MTDSSSEGNRIVINPPRVELINVVCDFEGAPPIPPLTFNVTCGEFVCLHGPTGSGKTVALNLICGLLIPTSGEVRIEGELINNYTPTQRLWLRRVMGIMEQDGLLLDDMTILENVMIPGIAAQESYAEVRHRAHLALRKCHIGELADLYPTALSAGQRQLVCLARAIVNWPAIILADEPAAHLDMDNAQILMDLLGEFARAGVAVIVASHLELQPSSIACRSIPLGGGL